MTRLLTAVFAAALAGLVTLTGGLAAFMTSLGGDCTTSSAATDTGDSSGTPASPASLPGWDSEQVGNAVTIVTVGVQLGVPPRGQIIALATAIQESGLRNLPYGDQDSLGLFQQRPSQGWGTPAQILDPAYAATRFYQALLAEPGWQTLPLTVAAQGVQHSGHPDAYAAHETAATQLYAAITGTGAPASTTAGACVPAAGELTSPSLPAATRPTVERATSGRGRDQLGVGPTRHALLLRRRLHRGPLRQPRAPVRLLQPGSAGLRARRDQPAPHRRRPVPHRHADPRGPDSARRSHLRVRGRRNPHEPRSRRPGARQRLPRRGAPHRRRRAHRPDLPPGCRGRATCRRR